MVAGKSKHWNSGLSSHFIAYIVLLLSGQFTLRSWWKLHSQLIIFCSTHNLGKIHPKILVTLEYLVNTDFIQGFFFLPSLIPKIKLVSTQLALANYLH